MPHRRFKDVTRRFEDAIRPDSNRKQRYLLRLYVTGATARSARAIVNIKAFCEEHLRGSYVLEVIDIYQQPELAKGDQIVAVPTLIKQLPSPLRRFIGDMSRTEHILLGLDLRPSEPHHEDESDINPDPPRF